MAIRWKKATEKNLLKGLRKHLETEKDLLKGLRKHLETEKDLLKQKETGKEKPMD